MASMLVLSKETKLVKAILAKDWPAAEGRIEACPSEVKTWTQVPLGPIGNKECAKSLKSRVLPLHLALRCGAPPATVRKLLKAYPKALLKRDSHFCRLPIHFACLYSPSEETVRILIKGHKASVSMTDGLFRLPLHYAAFGNASDDVYKLLLSEHSEGARVTEMHGWLPLHIAVKEGCSFAVLKLLVESHPDALSAKTKKGADASDIVRKFHEPDSNMAARFDAILSAVHAVYDLSQGQLSLSSVTSALWLQEEQNEIVEKEDRNDSIAMTDSMSETSSDQDARSEVTTSSEWPDAAGPDVDNSCVICLENVRTHAFVPCGHLCVCRTCAQMPNLRDRKAGKACPLCRKQSFMVIKVYS